MKEICNGVNGIFPMLFISSKFDLERFQKEAYHFVKELKYTQLIFHLHGKLSPSDIPNQRKVQCENIYRDNCSTIMHSTVVPPLSILKRTGDKYQYF